MRRGFCLMHFKSLTRYLILAVLFLIFILLLLSERGQIPGKHLAVNLAYATRPLWDSPQKPFTIIPHYYSYKLSDQENCVLNGFQKGKEAKVFDAILFSVELDLLEVGILSYKCRSD